MSSRPSLSAEVLGQIALMQSMVAQLPDKESMLSFACQGLNDLAGVAEAVYRYEIINNDQGTDHIPSNNDERIFPIIRGNRKHADIILRLTDAAAFLPYTPYIENFCNMLAVIFEEIHQREENRRLLDDLERRVENRTKELEIEIQERQKAEEQLSYSNSLTNAALEASADGILIVKRDGKIARWNEKFVSLWQIPGELHTDNDAPVLQHVTTQMAFPEEFLRKVKELYENPDDSSIDLLHLADGRIFERYSQPAKIGNEIVARFWSFRDITERKRNEQLILAERDRAQKYLDTVEAIIVVLDDQGRISLINRKGCEILARSENELIGTSWFTTCLPNNDNIDKDLFYYRKLMRGEVQSKEYFENTIISADGNLHEIAWHNSLLLDEKGSITGTLSAGEDITERKRSEEALKASRTKLEAALASMTDAVFISDESNIIEFNDAFVSFHRFKNKEDCLKKRSQFQDILEFFTVDGAPVQQEMWPISRALRGEIVTYAEYALCRKDTGENWVGSYSFSPIKDHKGMIVGAVAVARDITELKKNEEAKLNLEAQLKQAQKMESVGRLAGGVAHDFNNMLGVILGRTEMALESTNSSDPMHVDLQEIHKAAERSANLTRQLLAFARKQTISPKILNCNEAVSSMLTMLRRLIGEDIDLMWFPQANLWPVKVDPTQLDQLLANLCVNARDAISGVGKVTIETENMSFDKAYCDNHPGFIPGEYIMLAVSDNGCGMDGDTLAHLYEPFFTTKEIGKGTGLGLATVYGIVKQNNGFINVYSEPDQGTAFKIFLPRYIDKAKSIQTAGKGQPITRGKETILLVEDEHTVLDMTKAMLERLGYRVIPAQTPGEAIRLAKSHKNEIDILVTDVVMPEMNGRDLVRHIAPLYPGIKTLFMSGYTANAIAHHGILDDDVQFIEKPFSRKTLAEKIREVLGQSTPTTNL